MSGHSHWATIRHKKESQDKARGTIFAKVSKEIALALQNKAYLRTALQRAKEVNLPKDNIQRIIDRSTERAAHLQEATYEGFGPGGSACIVTTVTDNTNRTLTEVRSCFSKHGGKLGGAGSVIFLFRHSGVFTFDSSSDEESVLACIEAMNAFDFEQEEGKYYAYVDYNNLSKASEQAKDRGFSIAPNMQYVPISMVELSKEDLHKALELKDSLEMLEDVQEVCVNYLPD